jgi:hypothetical protein
LRAISVLPGGRNLGIFEIDDDYTGFCMGDTLKPRYIGALLECFIEFPLFSDDYYCLVDNEFIRPVSSEQCEWMKSKTSLAEYFRWVGADVGRITGGFWCPISRAFGMNKGQLQKLAGQNGNYCKPPESRDFTMLKILVLPYRHEIHRNRKELVAFNAVKKLINDIKSKEPEIIHNVLKKIEKILCENVEKNK